MAKKMKLYFGQATILTALGNLEQTVAAMRRGQSGLLPNQKLGMFAGEIASNHANAQVISGFSRFESLIINQLQKICNESKINFSSRSVQLIISTTKGNVEALAGKNEVPKEAYLGVSAKKIAQFFGAKRTPIVISNACISGVSAFVVAKNLLQTGKINHAVIVGCDVLSEFISKGFASFKSISDQPCKPYDAARNGLTLGEACGAVVLTNDEKRASKPAICLTGGAVTNDANHISAPSRTGDGLFFAIKKAASEAHISSEKIGFVNTHGTATLYNDEMECKALVWAELDKTPLNSLKGYIGHTLGASGVVETILCLQQLREKAIFGTKNYEKLGVSAPLALSAKMQTTHSDICLKTASGFGGCNAAIVLEMNPENPLQPTENKTVSKTVAHYILPKSRLHFAEFIRAEYKKMNAPNMKFYKMSDLAKALYISVENLLAINDFGDCEPQKRGIILANRSASLDTDFAHQKIVDQNSEEGASPAVFVYTLPNVAAGEICIKEKIMGDNTFFVEERNSHRAENYAKLLIETGQLDSAICGWCDFVNGKWNVDIKLLKK